tara:strand:+ start:9603 stop:10121 length:519 start_codon:yes stop_codon:yes gene_type:complete
MVTQLIYKMIIKKKGISGIVATVIMIALVVGITSVLWLVINNLVKDQISSSESCFGNFGEVTLNKQYTCKNSNEIQFAMNIGDISIDSVLISVSGQSGAKSFEIKNNSYSYVKMYSGSYNGTLQLPGKNSGLTYVINLAGIGITDAKSIKIAPIINANQCEVSDSVIEISNC